MGSAVYFVDLEFTLRNSAGSGIIVLSRGGLDNAKSRFTHDCEYDFYTTLVNSKLISK